MITCPNCQASLEPNFRYCTHCGQKTNLPRFNVGHILGEFFGAFLGVDRSVLSLIRSLAVRPGTTAREYILEGRRKTYFNPFSFLLIVLALNLSVNVLVKPYTTGFTSPKPATQRVAPNVPSEIRPYVKRQRAATTFIEENINIVGLLAIPVFALVFWLFFRRSGIHYAEHLVAQVFFASFFSLFSIVITLALGFIFPQFLPRLNSLLLLFQLVYLTIAYYQFLNYQRSWNYVKTGLATTLALAVWFVVSFGAIYLYIQFGG